MTTPWLDRGLEQLKTALINQEEINSSTTSGMINPGISNSYILSNFENTGLKRLALQHQVWAKDTQKLYNKAGLLKARKILEMGCGPGYSVMDMSRGKANEIWGVDSSIGFVEQLEEMATNQGLPKIKALCGDLHELSFKKDFFDACFCRWVLMFLQHPEGILRKVYRTLKPGGVFAAMEYGPFLDISLRPASEAFDKVYTGVYSLIKKYGGNPDIGLELPDMLKKIGFARVETRKVNRKGKPGSPLWRWIDSVGENHQKLVDSKILKAGELKEYYQCMGEYRVNKQAVFSAPTVQQVIAYK